MENHDQPTIQKSKVKSQFRKKDILGMQDMLQNKTQVGTVNFAWAFFLFMRVIFFHLTNLSYDLHKLCIRYQISWRRFEKTQLDLKFLLDCKKNETYPKFVRWKNIMRMKRQKAQARYLHLLLNITNHFAWICPTSGYMSNASLYVVYI